MSNKISVCMATYNGATYIKAQLESILVQLGPSDEIIISDDSSTDDTIAIARQFNDARIRFSLNNQFRSPVFNFENAINHSTGDILFLSDQDDIWDADKVRIMLRALEQADLVVHDCYISDQNLNVIAPSMFEINRSSEGLIRNTIKNAYIGCCMAFHRRILKKCLPFPADIPMHDIWIGMVADAFYKTKFIKQKLVYYRRHGNNSVQWQGRPVSVYSLKEKIGFRWRIIKNLAKRIRVKS